MLTNDKLRIVKAIIALFIIVLAAYLRMGMPEIVEFKRDEANLSLLALDFASGENFPLLGITSSVGLPNAPINVYLLAIPYALSSSPVFATQFIGLLNVLAIVAVMWFTRRYTNDWAALMVGFLFAVSPWSIIFSRKIWAQNMLPLFVCLSLFTAYIGIIEKKRWAQVLHLPLLAFTGQIHYGAFVIIPAVLYVWWSGRRHIAWRYVGIGVVLTIFVILPYIVGLADANLLSLGRIRDSLATAPDTPSVSNGLSAVRETGVIISGVEIHSLAGATEFQNYLSELPFDFYPVFQVLTITVIAAIFYLLVNMRHSEQKTLWVMVLIWFLFPIVIYTINWTQFYIHYLIPLLPAVFLILAFAIHNIAKKAGTWGWWGSGICVGVVGTMQVIALVLLLQFLNTTYTPGGFGTPLKYLMPVREAILQAETEDIIGQVGGQNIGFDDEPTIWAALLYDVPYVGFAEASITVYNDTEQYILNRDCNADDVFWLRNPQEGCYNITKQPEAPDYEAFEADLDTFDNGIQVQGYIWTDRCLTLVWQPNLKTERADIFAVHYYNDAGERLYVTDRQAWNSQYWQAENTVYQSFCGENDTAVDYATIGMYWLDGDAIVPIDLVDFLDNPQGRNLIIYH